ncbi:hypothetical protein [Stenotrophomonas sp.]|uniref:beta family protein n=1 Tax=Stenotrophomonas sp. TaxID=69392 RepID=UPI0031E247A1
MSAQVKMASMKYLPILEVRPAEMMALQELPEKDKDLMLPLFRIRPWVAAEKLSSALDRLKAAFGERPSFVEVAEADVSKSVKEREVHAELRALRDSSGGFMNWQNFFVAKGNERFIPALQLRDPREYLSQVRFFHQLGRGMLVRIDIGLDSLAEGIARLTSAETDGGEGVMFVLDYGKQGVRFAESSSSISLLAAAVLKAAPKSKVAISASSFPDAFTGISRQPIFERNLYQSLVSKVPGLIFSDRGSARAERQLGGGGAPAPRIDFAKSNEWFFFRDDGGTGTRLSAYQRQAKALMDSEHWDASLKLWGCQMIEKTSLADESGITSPSRSTSARINIHIHQQLHYGDQIGLYDTDEEWVDI